MTVGKYNCSAGFTVHFLGDGLTIRTESSIDDGSFVATAGRPAGAQAFEGRTADAAFAKALACVREWRVAPPVSIQIQSGRGIPASQSGR